MATDDDPARPRAPDLTTRFGNEVDPHVEDRLEMVQNQLVPRGVRDPRVLDALRTIPRHRFVPPAWREHAHEDRALPIEFGQTISQPYMVGAMTQALAVSPGDVVLEVGTGSGYQTAVLAWLGARVVTIERIAELSARAEETLNGLGLAGGVTFRVGDGSLGVAGLTAGGFDGIVVTAAAPLVPRSLVAQLAPGGRLVVPVGATTERQVLRLIERTEAGDVDETPLCECSFVPLLGDEGWPEGRG
jgi:protein-L-isoaspartate(D-aspartate) O-methyltransferase